MLQRWLHPLRTIGLAVTLAACGDETSTTEPRGDQAIIRFENRAGVAIVSAVIRPCTASEWGSDNLSSGAIEPGRHRDVLVEPGCYVSRAIDAVGGSTEYSQLSVERGGTAVLRYE